MEYLVGRCFEWSAASLNLSGLVVNSLKVCVEGKKVILLLSVTMTKLQKLLIIKMQAKSLEQSQEKVDALALCCYHIFFF